MLVLFSVLLLSSFCLGQPTVEQIQDVEQTQTGEGYFRTVGFENEELLKLSSSWYQDDENQRLFLSVGDMDQNGWVANYWFLQGVTYTVNAPGDECIMYDNYGYDDETSAYNNSYLSFLGTHTLQEHADAQVDVYVGVALDAVGPLNVMIYQESASDLFYGMVITGAYGKFAFNEFWYGDNSTTAMPPADAFVLPDECLDNPKTMHYPYSGSIITTMPTLIPGDSSSHLQVNVFLYTSLLALFLLVKIATGF